LYIGISSYSGPKTAEAATIARRLGTPLLIHQPSYSLFNRWIEEDLLDHLEAQGMGCIVFSPLAQGLLTDRYLGGTIPADSRAARQGSLGAEHLEESKLTHVRALNEIAKERGQKLAQLAISWVLRDKRVTSALLGASSVEQLDTNLDALANLAFTSEELDRIDQHALEAGINLWARATEV
jgi:L-glyceraldehyde 3-phosphate reductase